MNTLAFARLAKIIWTSAALLSLAVTGVASARTAEQFTVDHTLKFTTGTDTMRGQLRRTPAAREIVSGAFAIAQEDLDDDGRPEFILLARSPDLCRDGGCALLILHKSAQGIEPLLAAKVNGKLALTKERVDGYRALAVLDGSGQIAVGNRSGSSLYGKQVVYTMRPSALTPTGSLTDEMTPSKESPSSANVLDKKAEKAVKKFLSSSKSKYESADSNGSAMVDLNGDGKQEIVLVWSLIAASSHDYITVFSQSAQGYKEVSTLHLDGFAKLSSANNGIIIVERTMYAKDDANCCPSIKKQVKYKWTGKKIVEMND